MNADALAGLLRALAASGYRFVTPTPLTHERVWRNREGGSATGDLRDVFGWNLPFDATLLPPAIHTLMQQAGLLGTAGETGLPRSALRVASLGERLYWHSSFPTDAADAVFFGPDTYRFARFIEHALQGERRSGLRLLDIGCGSGAGGLHAAGVVGVGELVLNDINPAALRLAAVNAEVAGQPVTLAEGDALSAVNGDFDVVVANPPYIADDAHRAYRDGGNGLGRALSVRMAREALGRLRPGGRLLLYTGVAIVAGRNPLLDDLADDLRGFDWRCEELDPDVFGEELERAAYRRCERIAAVGLVVTRMS